MKLKLLLALLMISVGSPAYAQCSGQPASGLVCGNNAASQALPAWSTITLLFDRGLGSTQGTILNRGSSAWSATATPSLGLNGGTGGALTLNGSSTGAATIGVNAAAGSTTFNLPVGNGTNGFVLKTDGSGNTSWTAATSGGTVSSVALALPGIFTVSGSPVTTTGTLTGTLATQSANTVWSGPTTGAAATPTFRALVGADLPNPSSSSLGGIQSTTGVSHQWISSISTSGVPGLTQPAFSDISGSLSPTQCPNPSASTLGCVESLVAVTSKWINTISTSGIPSATQPQFSDIGGNATLAQLPSISNNSVLGNNSGGTAVPSSLSASNVLDMINNVQGDVLYRNATGWVALAPGTNGQVLTTSGAAANPAWTTVTGTGTVTSVATNNGLTGGPITTTGTVGLATIATGNALAYTGAGSGVPVATTPSTLLDVIGSATGDILYRSGGGWTVLAPGTNGQVLTQGASTPAWGSAGTVSTVSTAGIVTGGPITTTGTLNINAAIVPGGRLTLATGTPVMTTTVSGATSVFYTPYKGNLIPIYDGTNMVPTAFAEVSQTLADTTKSPAAAVSGSCYDVFGWNDSGTFRATRGPAWTNATTRSAGTALVRTNGILLNNALITNGPAASRGTYLGTFCAGTGPTVSFVYGTKASGGGLANFQIWNMYNRVEVATVVQDSVASWTYAVANTWRLADAPNSTVSTGNFVNLVRGLDEDSVSADYNGLCNIPTNEIVTGIGINVTNAFTGTVAEVGNQATPAVNLQAHFKGLTGFIGTGFIAALEFNSNTATATCFGNPAVYLQTGLVVSYWQ